MRLALVLLVACGSAPERVERPTDELQEAVPPPATFKWSLAEHEDRCATDGCPFVDALTNEHVIAVYAPIDDTTSAAAVIDYDGDHVGGPMRWQKRIDLGTEPRDAVVTIVDDAVIVAAISHGTVRAVTIDETSGRMLGAATLVEKGAKAVRVEGVDKFARFHVLTQTGGAVTVMHPRNAKVMASRVVDTRAVLGDARMFPPTSENEDVVVRWESRRLVVRRGNQWVKFLRVADYDNDMLRFDAQLLRANDRMLVTVHDVEPYKVEVIALDRETGNELWSTKVTGEVRQSEFHVATAIDGDRILVRGVATLDMFTCALDLRDGFELACVDRTDVRNNGAADAIVTP